MKISTGEKSLMITISSVVLLCITVVYINHYFLEQQYENCHYYARGVTDAAGACRDSACSPIGTTDRLDFARDVPTQYRQSPALAQRYHRAYQACMAR